MARMVPVDGPRKGVGSSAHERLYQRLQAALAADVLVVHGPAWVGQDRHGQACDGAADFLICDPDRGLLLLNVLVGGLSHDPSQSRWTTGSGATIDDPFVHLANAVQRLGDMLAQHPTALPARPVMGHAICTPDILAPHAGFAAHAPSELVIDVARFDRISGTIDALYRHWSQRSPSSGNASNRWWLRVVERLFVAPVAVRARLGARVIADREKMLALDQQQVRVLDMLGRMRQVTVYGPAGTGKTVLAVAKAHSLASQGQRVLLTCYNKALGVHLRDVCRQQPNITAIHFHELCFQLLDLHSRAGTEQWIQKQRRRFWDEDLPARVIAAAGRLRKFDAVVVDEGQDFHPNYWRALEAISVGGPTVIRYIFFDDRQRLFIRNDRIEHVPGADEAVVLRTNWRNTQRIHSHIRDFEPVLRDTSCAAPEGVPVLHVAATEDPRVALTRVLSQLVHDEGIAPTDIVILTGKSRTKSKLQDIGGSVRVIEMPTDKRTNGVRINTVHAFKGLESPVVILGELSHLPVEERRRLHYVGASRAMSMLVVLADGRVEDDRP